MKCFECERQAVAVCRWCQCGQCEIHLWDGLTSRKRIPIMGCIHQYVGFRVAPEDPAASGR
jgi:hypothetical protein